MKNVIEVLVWLDPPQELEEAEREADNIVNVLVRAEYDAQATDIRDEDGR